MRFKDPVNAPFIIAEAAATAALNACYINQGVTLGPVMELIIREAIRAAIQELMAQQYTDEDFEQDLGLK